MTSWNAQTVLIVALCASSQARAQTEEVFCEATAICEESKRCREIKGSDFKFSAVGNFFSRRTIRMKWPEFEFSLRDVTGGNSTYSTYAGSAPDTSSVMFSLTSEGFFLTLHGLYSENHNGLQIEGGPTVTTYFGECVAHQKADV